MNSRIKPRQSSRVRALAAATVSIAAIALAAFGAPPARAQAAVTCVNCSTIVQQLAGYGRQLLQLQQEIQTAENTLNFYLTLIKDTASLPNSVYQDIQADINGIQNLANQATLIGGQTMPMLTNLSSASGYPLGNIASFTQEIINEDQTLSNAMKTAGTVLQQQQTQTTSQAASISAAITQSSGASGFTQAIQAGNTIAGAAAQQTAGLQTSMTTAFQALLTRETAQADRQAMQDAEMNNFMTYTPDATAGYQGF
jgi:type IV secretion system protein TrbJ